MAQTYITRFDPPPIPTREWDWCAYWRENDHHCGWGKTEKEAIADLQRLDGERADWEEGQEQLRWETETGGK